MHKLLVAAALFFAPFSANALIAETDCQNPPQCSSLGYTTADASADCEKVFCPFDQAYAKCVSDTCAKMGYTIDSKSHWCFNIKNCPYDERYTLCAEGGVVDPEFMECHAPLATNENCKLGDILFYSAIGKFHCTSLADYETNMLECIGEPKGVIAAEMSGKKYAIKTKKDVNIYEPTDRLPESFVTWSRDQTNSDSNTGRFGCHAAFNKDMDGHQDNYSYVTAVLIGKATTQDSLYVKEQCLLSQTKTNPGNYPERLSTTIIPHEFFTTPIVSGGRYWGFPNSKILKNIAQNFNSDSDKPNTNALLSKIGMDPIPLLSGSMITNLNIRSDTIWSLDYSYEQFYMSGNSLSAHCSPNCGNWDGYSIQLNTGYFYKETSSSALQLKPADDVARLETKHFGILVMDLENFGTPYKK